MIKIRPSLNVSTSFSLSTIVFMLKMMTNKKNITKYHHSLSAFIKLRAACIPLEGAARRKHVTVNYITHDATARVEKKSAMALTSRCRLRGRKISMEAECRKIISSRSDRYMKLLASFFNQCLRRLWLYGIFFPLN